MELRASSCKGGGGISPSAPRHDCLPLWPVSKGRKEGRKGGRRSGKWTTGATSPTLYSSQNGSFDPCRRVLKYKAIKVGGSFMQRLGSRVAAIAAFVVFLAACGSQQSN